MERIDQYVNCLSHLAVAPGFYDQRRAPLPPVESCYPDYLRDRMMIQDSRAYRRLGEKTQVFTQHPNPHIRQRSTHVIEVNTTATKIAVLTGLDRDLTEAIAWGHDIGHTPFGHMGERVLTQTTGRRFTHEIFGTIVAQEIERQGKGLNLTRGTLLGMRWHSGWNEIPENVEVPAEARVVMMADKIAYTFADVNDVERLNFGDIPTMLKKAGEFGESQRLRVAACVHALVRESAEQGTLSFERSEVAQKFLELRKWMYDNVYLQYEPGRKFQEQMLTAAYDFIGTHTFFSGCDPAVTLALMTDREVERLVGVIRQNGQVEDSMLKHFSFSEVIPNIRGKDIDFTMPSLI